MTSIDNYNNSGFENRPSGLKYWDANEIIDGLLLGSVTAAKRKDAFDYFAINAVLSILTESQMVLHDDLESHLNAYSISIENGNWSRFEFADARLKGVDIQKRLHVGADFIHKHVENNKGTHHYVMIHCFAGASRSPTITAAYLIKYKEMTSENALDLLSSKRNVAYPKQYFKEQLTIFEKTVNSKACDCIVL